MKATVFPLTTDERERWILMGSPVINVARITLLFFALGSKDPGSLKQKIKYWNG